jgi:type IV fimbrial biogenesis protein FimT
MKVRGFTLIELIITLLIGSLLLAWGVPNYRDFKLRREVVDNTNEFVYSMSLARAEAIRYGTDVKVVPDASGWSQGWIITADGVDGSDAIVIQKHDPVANMEITFKNAADPDIGIVFNRLGAVKGGAVEFDLIHGQNATVKRTIEIKGSGSAKVIES